jgi:hypothetical protein
MRNERLFQRLVHLLRKPFANRPRRTTTARMLKAAAKVKSPGILLFCLLLLVAQGFFYIDVRSAGSGTKRAQAQTSQSDGAQPAKEVIKPDATAVINFSELARQEAMKPPVRGPVRPQLIHAPGTILESAPLTESPIIPGQRPNESGSPLVPSPSPTSSFLGHSDVVKVGTGTIVIPPDTDGAVGLTKIFTTLNNNYVVQDKTTGAVLSAVSVDTFWSGIGGATGPYDPRILYDPYVGRWLVGAVSDSGTAASSALIGISSGSDPAGTYTLFRFNTGFGFAVGSPAPFASGGWADFPMLGFNKNWVGLAVNMFTISPFGSFVEGRVLALDYTMLQTGTGTGTLFTGASVGFCNHPVTTYSATEATLYLPQHIGSAAATYQLNKITGTPASPTMTIGATLTRTGGGWVQPSSNILPQSVPVAGASICGATPCLIDVGDAQVRSGPVFRNTFIYYTQTIGLPAGGLTHTAVQWTRLNTSGAFMDGGRIDDPTATATNGGKWYAYSSISVNKFDEFLVGFSQYASDQHPAAGYAFHQRLDAAGTLRDPFIYKAGEDYYHKTFGGARNRWGDYSVTQVDPSDDLSLWTLQEYAMARVGTDDGTTGSNSSRWSTWWAKLALAPTAEGATISGRITSPDGSPLGGAVMRLSGAASRVTITDSAGNYHFDDLASDNFYTVTPSLANYHFAPANRSFSLVGNITDAAFTANADASPSANAIDTTEYFVRQQYLDFLGREPDQGGLEYWSAQINQCNGDAACISQKRIDVSAAFFASAEFQQTGSYIYGVYAGTLGRTLNYGEFNADRAQVLGGSGLDQAKTAFAQAFVQRPEFTSRYPQGMTRDQFVDAVIQTMTQRSGVDHSSLRDGFLSDYDVGGRALVARHASEASSFVAAEYNKAFVLMEYFGYLRREIDQGGYDYWLDVLNHGAAGNYRGMVCAFLTSTEYQLRFSTVITRNNGECGQ